MTFASTDMHDELTSCYSQDRVVRRRIQASAASTSSLSLCRRHGLLAVLLAVDQIGVTDAFGGGVVGEISAARVGSGLSSNSWDRFRRSRPERRVLPRHRSSTSTTTTNAGEEQAVSRDSLSQNGIQDKSPPSISVTLDRKRVEPAKRALPSSTPGKNGSAANGSRVVTLDMLKSRTVDPAVVRDTVLHYLKNEKKLTSFNFVNLGMASSRYCDIHVVMEVLRVARTRSVRVDVRFMTNMVNAASKARRWVMAAQLLQIMRSFGITPNDVTFTSILSEMSKAKQHHMAAEMMVTEGLQKNLCAYNALISGCTSTRSYNRAMGYLNDMVTAGVQPSTLTFSSIIATTKDGSDSSVQRAFEALDTMKQTGMVPDTYCMNSLMAVGVAARQPNTALEIFREMANDGIARDVVSYNTAIAACDKLDDATTAVRLLREAREEGIEPDVFSYNTVISALGHSSLWEEAHEIFEEMHEAGVTPGLMTYNSLIAGCVRAEHPNEALSVFHLMAQRGIKQDQYSYAGALHACMHLRDSEKAMDLLDEMEQMGMPANAESFATAIRTCARCGKPDEATYVYREALRLAVVPTKVVFKALLEAFSAAKNAERAAWVLQEMDEMQIQTDQSHLLEALAACTVETDLALDALRRNEELQLFMHAKMYSRALEVCIAAGSYEAATAVVEMMERVGLQPDAQQEKRILQDCFEPSQQEERDRWSAEELSSGTPNANKRGRWPIGEWDEIAVFNDTETSK